MLASKFEYFLVEIGYSGAAGAGGDMALSLEIPQERVEWFTEVFFEGLGATGSASGFVRVIGQCNSIVFRCSDYHKAKVEQLRELEPKCKGSAKCAKKE